MIGLLLALLSAGAPAPGPLVLRLAEENGCQAPVNEVVKHLQGVAALLPKHGLKMVASALADPWSLPALADLVRASLSQPFATDPASFRHLPNLLEEWIQERAEPAEDVFTKPLNDALVEGASLLEQLTDLIAKARSLAALSNAAYGEAELASLALSHVDYASIDFKSHDPKQPATEAEGRRMIQFEKLLHKASFRGTLAAAKLLYPLADQAFVRKLASRLVDLPKANTAPELFTGDILLVQGDSDANRIVIGGKGRSAYKGRAALIIDLGGDDTYESAAVATPGAEVSVVLDLGGRDTYRGAGGGPAYACTGVSMLVDLEGNDTYEAKALALGSGCAGGIALLVDYDGRDTYRAEGYGEGYGRCGVGLLYDRNGNDSYDGWAYAQGSTQGWGVGALVDWAGNDTYLADQHFADTYGDSGPNVYHGGAQGSSLGLRPTTAERPDTPGGLAVLIDQAGKDRYQAGNFSQGGGYYFGFGLMYDGGGDDENIGTRYSQGYGVHQAVGIRWDAGGNDTYQTRCAANCGSAWDEGVGYLIDQDGDDTYVAGSLALGGAANTAIAVLLDGNGADQYQSNGEDTQGGTSDSSYHKKQSLGVMLDLGAGKDQFARGRKENGITWQRWFGLFLDAKEKSIDDVLKRKTGKLKGEEIKGRDT